MVDIIARLKIRAEEFSRGSKTAFGGLEKDAAIAGDRAGNEFAQAMSRRMDTLATGAGAAAVIALGKRSLDFVTNLKKESQQLGVSTATLQEYRFAASDVGVEQSDLIDSFSELTQKMGEARAGNKDVSRAFKEVGVDIETTTGRTKDMEIVFRELIGRLSEVSDPVERARLEAQLFGDEWRKIDPILRVGSDRIDGLRKAAHEMGAVISDEAIQNADQTARKLGQMKMVLEANIADQVARNSAAILGLANSLTQAAVGLAKWWQQEPEAAMSLLGAGAGARAGFMVAGPYGALVGAGAGYVAGKIKGGAVQESTDDANTDLKFRMARVQAARADLAAKKKAVEGGAIVRFRRTDSPRSGSDVAQAEAELLRQAKLLYRVTQPKPVGAANGPLTLPTSTGASPVSSGGSASGGSGRARSASGKSEAERAVEKQIEAEKRLGEGLQGSIDGQRDSVRLSDMRAKGLNREADLQEAILELESRFPGLALEDNKAAAASLGIRETELPIFREMFEIRKDMAEVAINKEYDDKKAKADLETAKKAQEELSRQQEDMAERQRRSVEDLGRLYADVFSGRSGDIWRDFKREGTEVIGLLAAQWTIAMMNGQKFDPLTALSGATSMIGGPGAALANALLLNGRGRGLTDQVAAEGGDASQIASAASLSKAFGSTSILGSGVSSTLSSIAGPLAIASVANSMIGDIFGFKGGPLGVLTSPISNFINPSRSAGATITGAENVSIGGKDKKQYGVAGDLSESVISGLQDLASQLGGTIGSFRTTIGVRDGDYRVNTSGTSLKIKNGAVEFDDDAEGAIAFAIADAVADGALQGISAASQRILTSGQEMGLALQKAMMIESIPDALHSRMDPVGYAIDQLNDKWKETIAALEEGGASVEQMTDAQKLYKLELEDVKTNTVGAAKGLKDFMAAMDFGSASPLSLRDQEKAVRESLDPYLNKINRGEAIDQDAYMEAAQGWLNIERQLYGSTSKYFEAFDSIQAATSAAIASIDNVTSISTASDLFNEKTATATESTAASAANMETLLQTVIARLDALGGGGSSSDFIGTTRNF